MKRLREVMGECRLVFRRILKACFTIRDAKYLTSATVLEKAPDGTVGPSADIGSRRGTTRAVLALALLNLLTHNAAFALTKKEYVDQEFGMFIHFNMSTYARQDFYSIGGEHGVGPMPPFDELNIGDVDSSDKKLCADDMSIDGTLEKDHIHNIYIRDLVYPPHKPFGVLDDGADGSTRTMFKPDKRLTDRYAAADKDGDQCLSEKEYKDIREYADRFNPKELDIDNWARLAKEASMKYAVLTVKHHDGFLLWSFNTEHGVVSASQWKGVMHEGVYEKDIVRLFVDAFRKHGLKVGLYYSIWDKARGEDANVLHSPHAYVPDFNEYVLFDKPDIEGVPDISLGPSIVKDQLTSLIRYKDVQPNYGHIDSLWFDGWGWKTGYVAVQYFDVTMPYDDEFFDDINFPIFVENYSNWDPVNQCYRDNTPVDLTEEDDEYVMDVNTEAPKHREDCIIDSSKGIPLNTDIVPFERNFRGFPPVDNTDYAEVSDSMRAVERNGPLSSSGGENRDDRAHALWFYHPEGNDKTKSLDDIVNNRYTANARKASYLLNITPDEDGKIPQAQVDILEDLAKVDGLDNLNARVKFNVVEYGSTPFEASCPNGEKKYGFIAKLINSSGEKGSSQGRVLSVLHIELSDISNGNYLLLKNGDYLHAGDQFMVSGVGGVSEAGLAPYTDTNDGPSGIDVPFTICLNPEQPGPFSLHVHVKGIERYDDSAPALIQGSLGDDPNATNFEMIVRDGDRLCHWWRNNAGGVNEWDKTDCFGENVYSAPAFIRDSRNNNFEVVYRTTDNRLRHYYRDNRDPENPVWKLGNWAFGDDVASAPGLVQTFDGFLQVVYQDSANRLRHWQRDLNKVWEEIEKFGANATSAPALIADADQTNDLHVVVRESNRLRHYVRINDEWLKDPELFGANVTSAPALIRSDFGNFEVVVREGGSKLLDEGGSLRHYWAIPTSKEGSSKEDDKHINQKPLTWNPGILLPNEGQATSPAALIQGHLAGVGDNFELVVREGSKLVHYFRVNDDWDTSGEIKE